MIEEPPILTINRATRRPNAAQIAAFQNVPTGFVVDALYGGGALSSDIQPVGAGRDIECIAAGPALTADCGPADILATLAALKFIQPGDIVISAFAAHQGCASAGDRVAGMMKNSGAVGFVTDGPMRDYDGVVAIHPAYNFVALQLGGLAVSKAIYDDPESWLSPTQTSHIGTAVTTACDGLDGLIDGIIANTKACQSHFQLSSLACDAEQQAEETCLTPPQIVAVKKISSPASIGIELSGATTFGGWPILDGSFAVPSSFQFGQKPVSNSPPTEGDALVFVMADQGIRYLVLQEPEFDSLTFKANEHRDKTLAASVLIDADSTNLDQFREQGGKLLLMHGTVDMAIPPSNSIRYYERLSDVYSGDLQQFVRFYIAPGFGHGDGPFPLEWDSLAALDNWVSKGEVPPNQVVFDLKSVPNRSLPLCEYPLWPQYSGEGDVNHASSFHCTE